MLKNYLLTAWRRIKKAKIYSVLNILGLAVGMAAFILIFLYVRYELSFDRWHENADHIYRVVQHQPGNSYLGTDRFAVTPAPLAEALIKEYPEVIAATRLDEWGEELFSYQEKHYLEKNVILADPQIFEVFSLQLLAGNPAAALSDPHSILLSESTARKNFGNQNPIGRIIRMQDKYDMQVTGIFKNLQDNSHFTMDVMIPFDIMQAFFNRDLSTWNNNSFYTYFLLDENAESGQLEAKLPALLAKYTEKKSRFSNLYYLQPLTKIHLYSHINFEISPNNDIKYIYLFATIGLLLLLIACINYVNLATAGSAKRAKEVGMRKVVGAHRFQLVRQFFGESALMAFFSLFLTLGIVALVLPTFNRFVQREIIFNPFRNPEILIGLAITFLLVAGLAGIYPAAYISRFRPVNALNSETTRGKKASLFRSILVVFQFSISILLIISTFVVNQQLHFIQNQKMGYSREHIVVVPVRDTGLRNELESLKTTLNSHLGILSVSASSSLPNHIRSQTMANWPGKPDDLDVPIYVCNADYNFVDVFELEIIQGRNFSRNHPADTNGAFLINESALEATGWGNPIGREFSRWGNDKPAGRVVGVVKDFHMHSLHQAITPLYIFLDTSNARYISIKIRGSNIASVLAFIEETFQQFSPGYPFEYSFFDDVFNKAYQAEQRLARLFSTFAFLTIFIACLGLFGLASYSTAARTKEIGIRKVLGASSAHITTLISREYIVKVMLAVLISWPLGYYAMSQWLQNFAYRVELDIIPFVISGLIALFIALMTVAYHTLSAAAANPADTIRYE